MIKYKKLLNFDGTEADCIKLVKDNQEYIIPFDEANKDYREYLEWVAKGNTPEEAD
jgi:hypothetical protein